MHRTHKLHTVKRLGLNLKDSRVNVKDFDVTIKLLKNKRILVPLGIPNFRGKQENKFIEFEIRVAKNAITSYQIDILNNGKTIFSAQSGVNGLPKSYGVGRHIFKWDGFDNHEKYDSKIYTTGKFQAKITGQLNEKIKIGQSDFFSFKRKEKEWVDIIIDKVSKRIDINLKVHLRDGGEVGTKSDCHTVGSGSYTPERTVCPWDEIPSELISQHGPPIKTRTKSFKLLRDLALEGISIYWSRRFSNTNGTIVNNINWEIITHAIQDEKGMIAPKIVYFTNSEETNFTRSHNWELSRKLFYIIGYTLRGDYWDFQYEKDVNPDFIATSAHEIGHEILLAYGGHMYSKKHKGTSTIMQNTTNEKDYPKKGEIDLMKYYKGYYPTDFYERCVANKKDVLSLIWLTKIELK